ncbi:DUF4190 domain-containing protein [Leucobacter denitrificans]|uniref:DUF4190 domain-containing protein n=1 Tax=Leucobacter denitrificans TaxID=683042 RepID=A0A7G9S6L7_9MICO|nr:DUF4190 domain-containing protein [Leucobacter denitrificans]QNN63492.1 DUF4190 domain-containing protein [Leucobacter denitrificans]
MTTTPPEYPQQQYAPQTPQASQAYGQQPLNYASGYAEQKPLPTNTTVKDTNTYSLVAVILAFIVPLAGIIFGHIGLSQIKRTGDAGRGLALTALIYGYCVFALGLIFFVTYIGFIVMIISAAAGAGSDYYY